MEHEDLFKRSSYSEVMSRSLAVIKLEAGAAKLRGYGGILNIFSSPKESSEELHLIKHFAQEIGILENDTVHIDIETLVTAIELGVGKYKLEIPENALNGQTLSENVFQYVYKGFGEDEKGWRIGFYSLVDEFQKLIDESKSDLTNTPFAEFIDSLNLDQADGRSPTKMIVLHFPPLDKERPIKKGEDGDLSKLTGFEAEKIEKYLRIYSLITQVYPVKFRKHNPTGNVIVNVLDNSYKWFAARNNQWFNAYEAMKDFVETPGAHNRDMDILRASTRS